MNVTSDEFTKAIYASTRFGNEKLNQLGYRRLWHHPTIVSEKGLQTPDGLIHNINSSCSIIAEFKDHQTISNMEKRIKDDSDRIDRYSTIHEKSLNKSLGIVSKNQDLAWFLDKSWIDTAGNNYFRQMEKILNNKQVKEWEVSFQRKNKICFKHIKRNHRDTSLNYLTFTVDESNRKKIVILSRESKNHEILYHVYYALVVLASKGERNFSLDEVLNILEANYVLCEGNNKDFRNTMRELINAFENKRDFKGVLQNKSRKSENWSFIFRVELGRDERRIKRIEDTYDQIKKMNQQTLPIVSD